MSTVVELSSDCEIKAYAIVIDRVLKSIGELIEIARIDVLTYATVLLSRSPYTIRIMKHQHCLSMTSLSSFSSSCCAKSAAYLVSEKRACQVAETVLII